MGNKRAKIKKVSRSKQEKKDRKRTEKVYGSTMSSARGQKREINPKRHKGKHSKGTRKKK